MIAIKKTAYGVKNLANEDFSKWTDLIYNYSQSKIPSETLTREHQEMFCGIKHCVREETDAMDENNGLDILMKVKWVGPNTAKALINWFIKTRELGSDFDQVAYAKEIVDFVCAKDKGGKKNNKKKKQISQTKQKMKMIKPAKMYIKKKPLSKEEKKQKQLQTQIKKKKNNQRMFTNGNIDDIKRNQRHQIVYVWILVYLIYSLKRNENVSIKNCIKPVEKIFGKKPTCRPDRALYPFIKSGEKFTVSKHPFKDKSVLLYVKNLATEEHVQHILDCFNDDTAACDAFKDLNKILQFVLDDSKTENDDQQSKTILGKRKNFGGDNQPNKRRRLNASYLNGMDVDYNDLLNDNIQRDSVVSNNNSSSFGGNMDIDMDNNNMNNMNNINNNNMNNMNNINNNNMNNMNNINNNN
eukprot:454796_1